MTGPTGTPSATHTPDLRSALMQAAHDSGANNLPALNREVMALMVMAGRSYNHHAKHYLSWDIGMNFDWDRMGGAYGEGAHIPAFEAKWARAMTRDQDILLNACDAALKPYITPGFSVMELGAEAQAELEPVGPRSTELILTSFRGSPFGFDSEKALHDHIRGLSDAALVHLWATTQILNDDLSAEARGFAVSWELGQIRAQYEEGWLSEDLIDEAPADCFGLEM